MNGDGVERSPSRGLIMLGAAATLGSEHACAILGQANAEGHYGFDKDPQEATRWYREMKKCDRIRTTEEYREKAAAWLRAPVEMPSDGPRSRPTRTSRSVRLPREAHTCSLLLVCVCTLQCVPSVATRGGNKIYS